MKKGTQKKRIQYAKKNVSWMVDQDYSHKLSAEEKAWLSRFNQEYYDNSRLSEVDSLHNTPELKKSCYNATNARNRDLYGIKDSAGLVASTITRTNHRQEEKESSALAFVAVPSDTALMDDVRLKPTTRKKST
jgi:hypothetical protein